MDARAPIFATLGCRLNAYETEAMRELSAAAGLDNAVIVNTCAVTAEAVRKAKQEIRRLRRENPDSAVIVTGCAAQNTMTNEERVAAHQARVRESYDISDESLFDLFRNRGNPEQGVVVNRYLWQASLDTLSFLPMEGADPFSGVIVTDWGRVAGDPTPFRVTVYISEAALDARLVTIFVIAFLIQVVLEI